MDQLTAELKEALASKNTEPETDKTKLNALIKESEALKAEEYTSDSWSDFEQALRAAKATTADPNASQQEVDDAYSELKAAKDALKKKDAESSSDKTDSSQGSVPPSSNPEKGESPTTGEAGIVCILLAAVLLLLSASAAVAVKRRQKKGACDR